MKMVTMGTAILLLAVLTYSSYGLVEPRLSLSPIGSVANFTCVLSDGYGFLRWDVTLVGQGGTLRVPGQTYDQDILSPRGITASFNSTFSVLYVNATLDNNNTLANCVSQVTFASSEAVTLIVYDRPEPPTDLSSRPLGSGRLLLTWTRPYTLPGVDVWYGVIVYQQGSELGRYTVRAEQYEYSFAGPSSSTPCQPYQFAVSAANRAGESGLSQLSISSEPGVPRILSAGALLLRTNGTDGSVLFHVEVEVCADYPVQDYCVALWDAQNVLHYDKCTPASNSKEEDILVRITDGLQPNRQYLYAITAVNLVGNSTTSAQTLYTSSATDAVHSVVLQSLQVLLTLIAVLLSS